MIRVADYIMQMLNAAGADHIFLVTGRGILYLSDAAAKLESLQTVSMHHEQACAYAASAYSSYREKPGACLVSTGCAGTNAVTGVLCAWQDGVPCVFVSGQNTLRETSRYSGIPLRTWGQQEADIISVVEPITKYAVMLTDASKTVYETEKALYMATHGRKGPVWIDVPLDIQNARIEPEEQEHFIPPEESFEMSAGDAEETAALLASAERPVILIGSGIRAAGAEEELKTFVRRHNIPVVYGASAPDVMPLSDELSAGSAGMMACTRSGCFAVQNADLVISAGCRLSPMLTGEEYGKFARAAKLVVVDIDETEHSKNTVKIDKFIKADAGSFLRAMNSLAAEKDFSPWAEKCRRWKEIFPVCGEKQQASEQVDLYYLAKCLSEAMPSDCVFLSDAGLEELIMPSNIDFSGERRCIHPSSQGAMGYALPAAIGAYYSSGKPTAAVIGDGSVMMNLQELATIAYNKLPLKIIIANNRLYSVIRKRQKDLFRTRLIGTDETNGVGGADFSKLADAFGLGYMRIENSASLKDGLYKLFAAEGAVICEVMCAEDQKYPACAYARNSEKRFVQRPLEDQAPFLDRELFLSEMIIEPIDQ